MNWIVLLHTLSLSLKVRRIINFLHDQIEFFDQMFDFLQIRIRIGIPLIHHNISHNRLD